MPYDNVPQGLWDKMDQCKKQVMAGGQDEQAAIAICYASIVEGKSAAAAEYGFVLDLPETTNIKAAGDFELEVLGVPFGGPYNGADSDGQFFSQQTEIMHEQFPQVPVFLYHGYDAKQRPVEDPQPIGVARYDHQDGKGHWFRVALDKASAAARALWQAAVNGTARASSGAIAHLVRIAANGEILTWPLAELSLMDASTSMKPANPYAVALPVLKSRYAAAKMQLGATTMDPQELEAMIIAILQKLGVDMEPPVDPATLTPQGGEAAMQEQDLEAKIKEILAQRDAAAQAKTDEEARVAAAVEAAKADWEAKAAANNRLPSPRQAPTQTKYGETWKFDNHTPGDLALAAELLLKNGKRPSDALLKSIALKMENDHDANTGEINRAALKAAGIKADETDYTSNTSYGAEWLGTAYSTELWLAARGEAMVAGRIPVGPDIPAGYNNVYIPVESSDPIFYKVPEATDSTYNSTNKFHNGTVLPGPVTTATKQITVGKMGTRVIFTGELEEDSLVGFAANARRQLGVAAAEVMDYVVINGDTDASASTNINAIDTTPAATDLFLLTNGFRKSPLITTTANSRSAGGSLDITDFIETVKLMGSAGLNALDITKTAFLLDLNTYWKALSLPEVLTRDANSQATVENGRLSRVYGYEVIPSAFFHGMNGYGSAKRMANSAGKVDADTDANNLYGAILAVRWDQWQLRFKRRWTLETVRRPESDTTEIVGLSRWGLGQRDTEASAITYYVGV